jgi:hypothetical protein
MMAGCGVVLTGSRSAVAFALVAHRLLMIWSAADVVAAAVDAAVAVSVQ